MTSPSIITLQQKLSTTSSLLLERSRVLSLSLSPSASSQNQIVRNLTVIKNELDKLFSAAGGAGTTGKGSSGSKVKTKGGDMDQQVEEMAEQYDRLLDLFAEDEVGREKGKALRRVQRYVLVCTNFLLSQLPLDGSVSVRWGMQRQNGQPASSRWKTRPVWKGHSGCRLVWPP